MSALPDKPEIFNIHLPGLNNEGLLLVSDESTEPSHCVVSVFFCYCYLFYHLCKQFLQSSVNRRLQYPADLFGRRHVNSLDYRYFVFFTVSSIKETGDGSIIINITFEWVLL